MPEPTPAGLEECQAVGLVCEHGIHAADWCDICDADEEPRGV